MLFELRVATALANRFYRRSAYYSDCTLASSQSTLVYLLTLARTTRMYQSMASKRPAVSVEYEEAVRSLNSLQSNAAYINAAKRRGTAHTNVTIQDTKKYLIRSGLSLEQVDSLSVIHVAGTKGKGSTCAFVEAILREHGFRTGFYSSPHLISVRERIRIDGRPISELEFNRQFWHVYGLLEQRKEHEQDMPQYFKFLTILMFHVFIKANVDVAILEVGIGGEYDCTNIVNGTACTGITSLGLDHTSLLGETLDAIAWQKSGIFKNGAPAFTVPQQNEAMTVLQNRALEKNCTLSLAPSLDSYPWRKSVPTLGIRCSIQKENASLAIQLAGAWMARRSRRSNVFESVENKIDVDGPRFNSNNRYVINDEPAQKKTGLCFTKVAMALESCKWPGRTQFLPGRTIDFYIDGAHTDESMSCCVSWFRDIIKGTKQRRKRYLIFNTTGDRDSAKLLAPLKELDFHKAFFVPNVADLVASVDQENYNMPVNKQMEKCHRHAEIWGENSVLAECVYESLEMIRKYSKDEEVNVDNCKPQVLVTGSLHLVGAVLSIVDPELSMTTNF